MVSVPVYAAPFSDTDGHWGQDAIERWSDHGVVNGSDGEFRPNDSLTRAELAVIISNLLKLEAQAEDNPFADLDDNWYTDSILKCYAAGIMSGDGTNVRPNDPVSREEAMVMLTKALHIAPEQNGTEDFADGNQVSNWAEGAVNALLNAGVVNGVSQTELDPQGNINRASVVTILNNAIGVYVASEGETVEANGGMVLVVGDNVTITGEADKVLILGDSKDVALENLTVEGDVTVTGESTKVALSGETAVGSVTIADSAAGATLEVGADAAAGDVTVAAKEAEVSVDGQAGSVTASGENTTINVSGKVDEISVAENAAGSALTVAKDAEVGTVSTEAAKTEINVQGTVDKVAVAETAGETAVKVDSTGKVDTVETKAESVEVSGKGEVSKVEASGDNTAVTTPGTKVEASEGTTGVTAGGDKVEAGESSTTDKTTSGGGGGSSTSDSSSHKHSYTAVVTEPTCETEGYTTYTCRCGRSYTGDTVAKLEHKDGEYCATCKVTYAFTAAGLKAAVAEGGNIKLGASISIEADYQYNSKNIAAVYIPKGKTVVLDLNGYNITNTTPGGFAIVVAEGGNLTINGNGTVYGGSHGDNCTLVVYGQATINGGTYRVGGDANDLGNACVEANGSGSRLEIYGGTFECETQYAGKYWVLNLKDNTGATIVVYGGTFVGQNPADTKSEPTNPTSFVADGYYAVEKDGKYTVTDKWDGTTIDTSWYNKDTNAEVFVIKNAAQLAGLADLVNSGITFVGKTVKLEADIDLNNMPWTPIGANADDARKFKGTFDGDNHKISNLKVVQDEPAYKAAGFFGVLNGTAKDFTLDGVDIKFVTSGNFVGQTDNGIAAVAGSIYTSGTIDNVTVNGAEIEGNRRVAGIAGYVYGTVKNCTVTNSYFTAIPDKLHNNTWDNGDKVGGIVGYMAEEGGLSGNRVENVALTGYRDIGGIVGATYRNVTDSTVNKVTIAYVEGDFIPYDSGTTRQNAGEIAGRLLGGATVDGTNTVTNVTLPSASEPASAEPITE